MSKHVNRINQMGLLWLLLVVLSACATPEAKKVDCEGSLRRINPSNLERQTP